MEAPEPLTGWVQVKKSKIDKFNMMKYYAHLKSPGVVYLYSDENSQLQHEADLLSHISTNTVRPVESYDLSLAVLVSPQVFTAPPPSPPPFTTKFLCLKMCPLSLCYT
jgi:hypothetical protein